MGMIRKIVKGLLGVLAGLALLLALAVGVGLYLNDRAERRAAEFCGTIAIASNVSEAEERATRMGIRNYRSQDRPVVVFMFPGWIFNWAECQVEINEGRVTQKRITGAQD